MISSRSRPATLQVSPGNETHLHAFATRLTAPDGASSPRYLRTSPEFACKKLLAAGERRIVEFAKVFRNRERGALHAPEFTLVEWYRAGEPYQALMNDCAAILAQAAQAAGTRQFSFRGRTADPFAEPERLSVADAFERVAGIDLLATLGEGSLTVSAWLAPRRRPASVSPMTIAGATSSAACWWNASSKNSASAAQPFWTISVGACRWRGSSDPRVAERFELYVCGVEIANGFGELTDATEQRRRLEQEMAEKQRRYGERYPLDEDFLAALSRMPDARGIALGLDRLVMLASGASHIDQVLWAPMD